MRFLRVEVVTEDWHCNITSRGDIVRHKEHLPWCNPWITCHPRETIVEWIDPHINICSIFGPMIQLVQDVNNDNPMCLKCSDPLSDLRSGPRSNLRSGIQVYRCTDDVQTFTLSGFLTHNGRIRMRNRVVVLADLPCAGPSSISCQW